VEKARMPRKKKFCIKVSMLFFFTSGYPVFWWGIMTLTTVGYDHKSPQTFLGKVVGGLCALSGIFILTLPIPIVVNSFAAYYKNREEAIQILKYAFSPVPIPNLEEALRAGRARGI
jgi:hypothetical protein